MPSQAMQHAIDALRDRQRPCRPGGPADVLLRDGERLAAAAAEAGVDVMLNQTVHRQL